MRARLLVLATLLCTSAVVALPENAGAAPARNHGLTIASTPNLILAGQSVLIYGHLNGPDDAGQTITLYHRVNPQTSFSVVSATTTDEFGFYEFLRADGVVLSNRSWFVCGPSGTHSRTVHEGVAALVSLNSSTVTTKTAQPVVLSGHVGPSHPSAPVKLQEQNGLSGDDWSTIATTSTDASSNFSVPHRWALPGIYTLRAVFSGDAGNLEGDSDSTTVTITQKQDPSFTVNSSAPTVPAGQPITVSGVLYEPGSTATVEPSTRVTLYGKQAGGILQALATTVTGLDGSYSFSQSPARNEVYRVGTTKPHRVSANLYEGVQDVVTMSASSAAGVVGGTVSLGGTVTPDHTGHIVHLQLLGADGYWHNVATGVVASGSTYSFTYTFGETGEMQLRARIYGGPENVGGASLPVTIAVSGVAPVASLLPAS